MTSHVSLQASQTEVSQEVRALMRIPDETALWLQDLLLGYSGECWGMADFVLGKLDSVPQQTKARWQLGVDMVYRTVTCDLVQVEGLAGFPDLASFFHAIQILSPDDKSGARSSNGEFVYTGPDLWNASQICGTKRLFELVNAHFPPVGEIRRTLNPAFIEALEAIFAENGVPWSDEPLLPIMPANSAAAAPPR
jgi:hypothetical protein